jgi:caspase domain-containing protein
MPSHPDPAFSAAVLIGGSTYHDARLSALPSVVNNLTDLSDVLTDTTLWGLPKERCRALLDWAQPSEIMVAVSELADLARDTLLVYYSGHGIVTDEGDFVLSTRLTSLERGKFTSLPYAWVREVVGQCRALRRIVVLDCCFSGRALLAMSDPTTTVIGQVLVDGTYVLTSAPATSVSLAPLDARNTAFTGSLLELLHEGVPGRGELLTLDDMYEHTLHVMARHGWPRPQRLGTNTVGRLGILRNRAWRRILAPRREKRPVPSPRHRGLAEGVLAAVEAVSPALGPNGRDGLEMLDHAVRGPGARDGDGATSAGWDAGVDLVRETMTAMREQYGDGATTAAIILGALVAGLRDRLDSGADPTRLDEEMSGGAAQLAGELSSSTAPGASPGDQLGPAVRTALGYQEKAEAVVTAAETVGAGNVEVVLGTGEAGPTEESAFVLRTTLLAPNAAAGPVALEEPLVVVSTDGEIDLRALTAEGRSQSSAILIIAPRVSIYAARGLLHIFSQIVVVRPADPAFDLVGLHRQLSRGGPKPGWYRARRAVVLAETTTIDRPPVDLELSRNRITLLVADPVQFGLAVRALAVARSVAEAGVVPGAGAALHAAARSGEPAAGPRPAGPDTATLVRAAACEPYRRLVQAADPVGRSNAVDSLATVRGALTHAVASAGRFLTES